MDTSTGSPAGVLMLSTQAVRGLRRRRAPGIIICISCCRDHSMLASLLWQCLTVPSIFTPALLTHLLPADMVTLHVLVCQQKILHAACSAQVEE